MSKGFKKLQNSLLNKERLTSKLKIWSDEKVCFDYLRTLNHFKLISKLKRAYRGFKYWGKNLFKFIEKFEKQKLIAPHQSNWEVFMTITSKSKKRTKKLEQKMREPWKEFQRVYLEPKTTSENNIKRIIKAEFSKEFKGGQIKLNSAGQPVKEVNITKFQRDIIRKTQHQTDPVGPFVGHGPGFEHQLGFNEHKGNSSGGNAGPVGINPIIPLHMAPPAPGDINIGGFQNGIHGANGAIHEDMRHRDKRTHPKVLHNEIHGGNVATNGPPPIKHPLQPIGPPPPNAGLEDFGIAPDSGQIGGQLIDLNDMEITIKTGGRIIQIIPKDVRIDTIKKKVR